jgi:CRP/FNR family transcriptional regulator, dissimilatory nitrate respiration regulator
MTSGKHDEPASLRSVPLFAALSAATLDGLLRQCSKLRRRAGTVLFGPAQPAERFFVVLKGRVKVYKLSPRGDGQVLHIFGPGEALAEAAVLAGGNYPAFAEVIEDADLLAVGRKELRRAVAADPELALGMLAGMAAKLIEFARLIEDLSLKDVPARLAAALLRMSRQAGGATFRLEQTKRDLAGQIGTVPETLSRALGRLRAAGLVRVRGRQITILDPQGLEELARQG